MNRLLLLACAVVALLHGPRLASAQAPPATPAGQPAFRTAGVGDENWDNTPSRPGLSDNGTAPLISLGSQEVRALLTLSNGDVIAGGDFSDAGLVPAADRIARWDGTNWHALGPGLNGTVFALALAPNGDIVAGGSFTDAGGNLNADFVARFDGTTWLPLRFGVNNTVRALAVATNGDVIAGGDFLDAGGNAGADFVTRFNGVNWLPLATGVGGVVNALALASNGDVLAGGDFVNAGGDQNVSHVARFNGTSWLPLQFGLSGVVRALAVALNGDILAGGDFLNASGNAAADRVARFTGGSWTAVGPGLNSPVYALAVASNGDVLAGGDFLDASGNAAADRVARFTGVSWTPLGAGLNSRVGALAVAANADVLAGGLFTDASADPAADFAARFTGAAWEPLQFGLNAGARAVVTAPNGDLIVGGAFTNAGRVAAADHIARWNGTAWTALGPGLNGTVRAVVVAPNGDIIAGGDFTNAGGNPDADFVARFNGVSWAPLGPGLNGAVNALTVEVTGDLLVGGAFTNAASIAAADYVARFQLSLASPVWSAVATTPLNNVVNAVHVLTDGSMLVGGTFVNAAGIATADFIARKLFNGADWIALAPGLNGAVRTIASGGPTNTIYVGGEFVNAGGFSTADYLARFNSGAWAPVGPALTNGASVPVVNALVVAPNGDVLAGGSFQNAAGNQAANNLARFDGVTWWPLGTGTNSTVHALKLTAASSLLTAGDFSRTGDNAKGMQGLGAYALPAITAFSPGSAITGQFIAISGNNLGSTTAVTFAGGAVATFLSVFGPTLVRGVIPAAATTGPLTLTTSSGPIKSATTFTKILPVITSFTPQSGRAGTVVTLTGTSLLGVTAVTFNSVPAAAFSANAAGTTVTATAPAGVRAGHIVVTTLAGPVSVFGFLINKVVTGVETVPADSYDSLVVAEGGSATIAAQGLKTRVCIVKGRIDLQVPLACSGAGGFRLRGSGTMRIHSAQGVGGSAVGALALSDSATYEFAAANGLTTKLPAKVGELVIDAPNVTLDTDLSIRRRLNLVSGNLVITGTHILTLLSNALGTALVVNGPNTFVSGSSVRVQRFINAGTVPGLGYRHMSAPVANTTINDLTVAGATGFAPVVNAAYNTDPSPLTVLPFPTVMSYDEARKPGATAFADGWTSPVALTDPLVPGRGYTVYMRGTASPDFFGTLNNGNLSIGNLTRTGGNLPNNAKAGWHLLGNPYPAPIDWDLVTPGNGFGQLPTGMSNSVSVFKTSGGSGFGTGIFLTRANGVGSLTEGLIPMAQAFFVQVLSNAPLTFTFTNTLRTTGSENPAHFRQAPDPRPVVSLVLRQPTATADEQDEAVVYVQAGAEAGRDALFDGAKPGRNVGAPTLVSLAGAEELAVNGLPETVLTQSTTVELLLDLPKAGAYELTRAQWANVPVTSAVVLLDRLTGTRYELAAQPTVRFGVSQAGEVRGRFALLFNPAGSVTGAAGREKKEEVSLWPNPARGSVWVSEVEAGEVVRLLDTTGRVVRTVQATAPGAAPLALTGLAPGMYTVRCGALTQRLVVE